MRTAASTTRAVKRPLELIKLEDPEQVDYGDVVYERVQFGIGPEHIKYNAYTIVSVERKACVVRRVSNKRNHGENIKLAFHNLFIEKRAPEVPDCINQPFQELRALRVAPDPLDSEEEHEIVSNVPPTALAAPIRPPTPPSNSTDAFSAWLDMGKELLAEIERERATLLERRDAVDKELEGLDRMHETRIAELEAELRQAKQDHQRDRALAAGRLDGLNHRLEALETRRAGVEGILKSAP